MHLYQNQYMMNPPFVFGKLATLQNFTDREVETAQIVSNFKSLISRKSFGRIGNSTKMYHIASMAANAT